MDISIPLGNEERTLHLPTPPHEVVVARGKNPPSTKDWAEVVAEAIGMPIGARPICEEDLRGRRVAIITDDWARPTPAHEVIPLILDMLRPTGVADEDITFITASGMHEVLSRDDLARKLGAQIVERYRCISHDAGDHRMLAFCGITRQGTPIWVNRYVAEAEYVIALGRVYPHESHGYEGGYKMILPGVSGFETITRDHSFNFSPRSIVGLVDGNPSRAETDEVGRMVGIDFLINVVVNAEGEPIKAFCGEPMAVFRLGVEYGDREVWGAEVDQPGDVVIVSPGSGTVPETYHLETLYRAARVTKEGGTLIYVAARPVRLEERGGERIADEALLAADLPEFQKALPDLALSEIMRLHELRTWPLDERAVQWRMKALRGEFYTRRKMEEARGRRTVLTPDPDAALQSVLGPSGAPSRIIVIPEGKITLPKERLFRAETVTYDRAGRSRTEAAASDVLTPAGAPARRGI